MSKRALATSLVAFLVLAILCGVVFSKSQWIPAAKANPVALAEIEAAKLTAEDIEATPPPQLSRFAVEGQFVKLDGSPTEQHIYTKRRGSGKQSKDMPYFLTCYNLAGELLWRTELQYLIDLIELPDGKVFVGGTMKTWLLDAKGNLLYEETFADDSHIFARFAQAPDGTILGLLNATWLYAFSPDGKFLWQYGPGQHQAYRTPLVDDNGTIILYDHNHITALDTGGVELWQRKFSRVGWVSLINNRLIYEPADFKIACLDTETGKSLWKHKYYLSQGQFSFTSYQVLPSGAVVLWALQGGVQCLDLDGKVLWSFDESHLNQGYRMGLNDCTIGIGSNIFVSMDSQLLALRSDGEVMWHLRFPSSNLGFMRTAGKYITANYEDYSNIGEAEYMENPERLLCFDSQGKLVWSTAEQASGTVSTPRYYDSGMIIWHVFDNENRETSNMIIWHPEDTDDNPDASAENL